MTFASVPEFAGAVIGFILTLLVFSYILSDNPLFRFATHLFIGVSAGFAAAVALRNVILPNLIPPLFTLLDGDYSVSALVSLVPILLSLLLLTKLSRNLGRMGNVVMAYLVGVGAAVAIGGAVLGTLFPQVNASINIFDFQTIDFRDPAQGLSDLVFGRFVTIAGTLATLIYFHFGARSIPDSQPQRAQWIESIARVGHGFIAITFGMLFAGVYAATITALIERVNFLVTFTLSFFY
jgi:hypothetical protein